MTRLVIAVITALLAPHCSPAQADTRFAEYCSDWASIGQMTMRMRQDGVPIKLAFDAVNLAMVDMGSPETLQGPVRDMIVLAYRHPLESTDRLAQIAAIRFSEQLFSGCMAHM